MKRLALLLILLAGCGTNVPTPPVPPAPKPVVRHDEGAAAYVAMAMAQPAKSEPTPANSAEIERLDRIFNILNADLERRAAAEKSVLAPPAQPRASKVELRSATIVLDRWFTDLEAAKRDARSLGRPLLCYYTGGDWCEPCQRFDHDVLGDPEVSRRLDRFICVRIDCPQNSDDARRGVPRVYVVTSDWTNNHQLDTTTGAFDFADQLTEATGWARTKARTATVKQTSAVAQSQPTERIVYVQAPSYSGGSSGGTYSGGSSGGTFSGGSSGGTVTGYYSQPTFYQPQSYYAPSYGYSGGGRMVCGANGCQWVGW
jgi:uncharacterized membrane protein YgcG